MGSKTEDKLLKCKNKITNTRMKDLHKERN